MFSDDLKNIVSFLLKVDPAQRPDVNQILGYKIVKEIYMTFPESQNHYQEKPCGKPKAQDTTLQMMRDKQKMLGMKKEQKDDNMINNLSNNLKAGDIIITENGKFYQKPDNKHEYSI